MRVNHGPLGDPQVPYEQCSRAVQQARRAFEQTRPRVVEHKKPLPRDVGRGAYSEAFLKCQLRKGRSLKDASAAVAGFFLGNSVKVKP